jgi:hypothetical protein
MTILDTITQVERETAALSAGANSSFSRLSPLLQFAWDSTSLSALKYCPRYYQYSIIEGYTTRSENIHLKFGIEFHAAIELYDRNRATGVSHETALLRSVRQAFINTWDFELKRPWTSDDPSKNRGTLIRAIVWYLTQFEHDTMETIIFADGSPAVEKSFRLDLGFGPEILDCEDNYILCGHIDKLVTYDDRVWVMDYKTTKTALSEDYFAKFSPDCQVSTYSIGGRVIYHKPIEGLLINGIQVGASFARVQRMPISRTASQLEEWLYDLRYWLHEAERFASDGYWPQNDKSCGMYGGCAYRKVCGASPEVRPQLLRGLYVKRVWDPLKTREI